MRLRKQHDKRDILLSFFVIFAVPRTASEINYADSLNSPPLPTTARDSEPLLLVQRQRRRRQHRLEGHATAVIY